MNVIDDHADASLVRLGMQPVEVGERAVLKLDVAVVDHCVPMIAVVASEDRLRLNAPRARRYLGQLPARR